MKLTQEQIDTINEKYLDLMPEDSGDTEMDHSNADGILVDILRSLGLDEIIAAYDSVNKWYS